jgi:putative ABC transport system ATP-binding protein
MAGIVMNLLESINADGTTIVMVTHDPDLASRASRNIHILDGRASDVPAAVPLNVTPLPERGAARV